MTVCIAAIADRGATVVLCADQLATHNLFGWAVETGDPLRKIYYFDDNSAVMAAGDLNFAGEVVRRAKLQLATPTAGWPPSFGEAVRYAYECVRRDKAQAAYLAPRGLTFASYLQLNSSLSPLLIHSIDSDLTSFNLNVELIAAESRNSDSMLWHIGNPGVAVEFTDSVCIGEGAGHAVYAMLEQQYAASLPEREVETMVRAAKVRSEKTRSVGSETSVCWLPRRESTQEAETP